MKPLSVQRIMCNNGTSIIVHDMFSPDYSTMSKVKKNKDGSFKCFRKLYVSVIPTEMRSKITKGMEVIEKYSLYDKKASPYDNFFLENDYMIPERDLNLFISYNDGIDKYSTVDTYAYMLADMNLIDSMIDWD